MCKDGAKTGKVALAKNIKDVMVVNEHVFILRPTKDIKPKYLFYYLYSKQGQLMLQPLKTRGGQGGINGTKLKMLNIPIIDEVKQNKIIEKCDKIMNEVNDKIKREKVSNIIEEYLEK